MTNRLDKLVEKSLESLCHSEEDRRSVTVSLTKKGRLLIDEAIEVHVSVLDELIKSLSSEDKLLLNGTLKKWLEQSEIAL